MTIQEAKKLYPKFYENPRHWVGYIWLKYIGTDFYHVDQLYLTDEVFMNINSWDDYIPLFKSQEEEVFTDYLTTAIGYALDNLPVTYSNDNGEQYLFFVYGEEVRVLKEDISRVKCDWVLSFSTSEYVDFLRSEQFYL